MARRRKMTPERREFINGLLEHYQPTDAQDVQEMLKDLLGDHKEMDWKNMGLGTDLGSALHIFWRQNPTRRSRIE